MLEELVVALIVIAALGFVVRRMMGHVPSRKPTKQTAAPDVPVDRLVRKKKDER